MGVEADIQEKLYACLVVLIHIGITSKSCIKDYWGDLDINGTEHIIKKYIRSIKFGQLDRYFQATKPWPKDDPTPRTTFDRVGKLSGHLQITYRKLYNPGTHLAVNKTIQRFMGRAPEILTIPSKPTPEGFM